MTHTNGRTGRELMLLSPTLDRDRLEAVLPMLSERQREVACLKLAGCSLRQIADRLHLGDSTVRSYIRRIRQVMG
jgi:RNA polymerase sigma factor (sigma-70 family)